jgi:inosine-uridine nucleoside N-ribohydrolase
MKLSDHLLKGVLLLFSFISFIELSSAFDVKDSPQKVIIDADIDSDVDDVGALAMLLNLHKAGTIELIGVVVTSDDPFAPVCAAAICKFYGLPEIPIGFLKNQTELKNHSKYTKFIAEEFPAELKSWQDAEEASTLYRKLLAGSPDESVIIVTIGHLSSLQQLLQSEPDPISKLNGKSLVQKKVKQWICMGGQYPSGKEANFYRPDPASTVFCVNNWEKDVIFCGWEAGNPIITGGSWVKENLSELHPVYRSYELYNSFAGRQSWDQLAVLQLVNSTSHFFSFVNGTCIVNSDGSNSWENSNTGKHRYLVLNPEIEVNEISGLIDRLMIGKM